MPIKRTIPKALAIKKKGSVRTTQRIPVKTQAIINLLNSRIGGHPVRKLTKQQIAQIKKEDQATRR